MTELQSAIPPDVWVALAGAVATLVLQAANARGYKLPLLSRLLDLVQGVKPPDAGTPAEPKVPILGDGKLLKKILAELKRRRKEKAVEPDPTKE